MKPAYWIGIMAVLGGIITYVIFRNAFYGLAAGILVGAAIYASSKGRKSGAQ